VFKFIFSLYFMLFYMFITNNVSPHKLEESLRVLEQHQSTHRLPTYIRSERSSILIRKLPKSALFDKVVYLTFDDGPSNNTVRVLDILKQYDVKATFFVNYQEDYEAIYKRIYLEGHAIGNHTYSHDYNLIYQSPTAFLEDYDKLNKYLYSLIGVTPDIMRFPGGSNNSIGGVGFMSQLSKEVMNRGIEYTDWNSLSGDAETIQLVSKEQLALKVETTAIGEDKVIVLMHDASAKNTTPDALPTIIEYFKAQGYVFSSLSKDEFTVHFLQ